MSKSRRFDLPEIVQRRALSEGEGGRAWLDELDNLVTSLENDWAIAVGRVLAGGSASFVAEAKTAQREDVILKIGTPESDEGRQEARVLFLAQGQGYVGLLHHDAKRRALLLERLGRSLEQLCLPVKRQIELICATLLEAWKPVPISAEFMNGQEKALSLLRYIEENWEATGRPCSHAVIQKARDYALQRADAFNPTSVVLAHGDPHAGNLLVVPETYPPRFKLVDPDGLFIEPAYDLGVMLRGENAELLSGNAAELARQRTRYASQLSGVEEEAIWQWSFIERVSTSFALMRLGNEVLAQEFLTASEKIAAQKNEI